MIVKKQKTKIRKLLPIILGVLVSSFLIVGAALALDTGLEYGTATGLSGETDIREMLMNIVRVMLGFLGVVAIGLIVYGGIVWMTSAGNAERIDKAKKILINAVIGLVIIMTSFMIVSFIINSLGGATGVCEACTPPASEACTPVGECDYTRDCQANSCWSGCHPDPADPDCSSETTYYPHVYITTNQICQDPNTTIDAIVTDSDSIVVNTTFYWENTTNLTPPSNGTIGTVPGKGDITVPWDTSGFDLFDIIKVTAQTEDEEPNIAFDFKTYKLAGSHCCNGDQDFFGAGDPRNEEGVDCGGSECLSCDGGDCDSAPPSIPDVCEEPQNNYCYSYYCEPEECLCATKPVIYWIRPVDNSDPGVPNGAPGNLVTIGGWGFGELGPNSEVWFTGAADPARLAEAVNPQCSGSWSNTRIIVEVPADADDEGPVQVIANNTLFDWTNDIEGPLIPDFMVNEIVRPGLCKITNTQVDSDYYNADKGVLEDSFELQGINFTGTSEVLFGSIPAEGELDLTSATQIDGFRVPNVAPGSNIQVFVEDEDEESNPIDFDVFATGEGPIIYSFKETTDRAGAYITITGGNFLRKINGSLGTSKESVNGHVYFGTKEADYTFPAECSTTYWSDDQIIVRVPDLSNGDYTILVETDAGIDDTSDLEPEFFTVSSLVSATPDICRIKPDNGPIGTDVNIYGQNFASPFNVSQINFYDETPQTDLILIGDNIQTNVPAGAITGPVTAQYGSNPPGNEYNFFVGECVPGSCFEAGDECCLTGDYAGSCMLPEECLGTSDDAAYFWSFSTGFTPGECSSDEGLCIPNNTKCEGDEEDDKICDPISCDCVAIPKPACTVDDGAVYFTGDSSDEDHIVIDDDDSLDVGFDDFSISAWFKHSTEPATDWGDYMIKKMTHQDCVANAREGYALMLFRDNSGGPDENDNKISFVVGTGNGCGVPIYSKDTYNDNEWHHVVAVADRNEGLSLYIDGTFDSFLAVETDGNNNDNDEPFFIGRGWGGTETNQYWNGAIDDVAFYKRTLGVSEISYLFANRPVAQDMVSYWRFNDDDPPDTVVDEKGDNNGAIVDELDYVVGHFPCQELIPCDAELGTSTCEIDHEKCPPGWVCNPSDCFCKEGISCDDTPATSSCTVNDEICKTIDPNLECHDVQCACVEAEGSLEAAYFWNFYSSSPGPSVVNECNRTNSCAKVCADDREEICAEISDCEAVGLVGPCIKAFSSPSPLYSRDGEVPVNAVISASFTKKVRDDTLIYDADGSAGNGTITINTCTGIYPNLTCTTLSEITGDLTIFLWDYGSEQSEAFNFTPDADLAPDTWYRVTVTSNVIGENGYPFNAFSWRFKTRNSVLHGDIGCVSCQPGIAGLSARFDGTCPLGDPDCQKYLGSAWSEDNVCVSLNPGTNVWDWRLTSEFVDPPRASILISQTIWSNTPVVERFNTLAQQSVYAISDTLPDNLVDVEVEIPTVDEEAYIYGDNLCELAIDLTTPVVRKRWPDCGAACTNALVGAAFSVPMEPSTLNFGSSNSGMVLYHCGDDPGCFPGYGACNFTGALCDLDVGDLDLAGCSTAAGDTSCDAPSYIPTIYPLLSWQHHGDKPVNGWDNAYLADTDCYDITGDGINDFCLLPNTYYRVILHNTIQSTNGKALGGLNYRDAVLSDAGSNDSYSWMFKTQGNLCKPGLVDVRPGENYMDIDQIDPYSSYAYANSDECDPDGQPLMSSSFTWEWQSSACWVADLLANRADGYLNNHDFEAEDSALSCTLTDDYGALRSGCGNGFVGPGEDCDDGNVSNEDACSDVCQWQGGVSISEFDDYEPVTGDSFGWMQNIGPTINGILFDDYLGTTHLASNKTNIYIFDNGSDQPRLYIVHNMEEDPDDGTTAGISLEIAYSLSANPVLERSDDGSEAARGPEIVEPTFGSWGWGPNSDGAQIALSDEDWMIRLSPFNGNPAWIGGHLITNAGGSEVDLVDGESLVILRVNGEYEYAKSELLYQPLSICGNNIVEEGEECDYGPDEEGDYCSSDCLWEGNTNTFSVCGNNIVEEGEECDTGDEPDGYDYDGCTDTCVHAGSVPGPSICGDGIVGLGEDCDTFSGVAPISGDGCSGIDSSSWPSGIDGACLTEGSSAVTCGNLEVEFSEECDDGDDADPEVGDYCNNNCLFVGNTNYNQPICGNNKTEIGEECDHGSLCKTSWGAIASCNSQNEKWVCGDGHCGSSVCWSATTGNVGNWITCDEESAATDCYAPFTGPTPTPEPSGICGISNNDHSQSCNDNCLHAGSVDDGRSHQLVQALYDGETDIQAWTAQARDVMGWGDLFVGDWLGDDEFGVVEHYPSCTTACVTASIGARCNLAIDLESLDAEDNIVLYECGSDSDCVPSLARAVESISVTLDLTEVADDTFYIQLPLHYNQIDVDGDGSVDGPALLPNTYYRVVISDNVISDEDELEIKNLNYDNPLNEGLAGLDSHSWVFRTTASPDLCSIGRVEVLPNNITLPPESRQKYRLEPWALPDNCDPFSGQRLNPYFYDWTWDDVSVTEGLPPDGENAAKFVQSTEGLCSLDPDRPLCSSSGGCGLYEGEVQDCLFDGCGNWHLEWGEDCDDGNFENGDGCSSVCKNEGSIARILEPLPGNKITWISNSGPYIDDNLVSFLSTNRSNVFLFQDIDSNYVVLGIVHNMSGGTSTGNITFNIESQGAANPHLLFTPDDSCEDASDDYEFCPSSGLFDTPGDITVNPFWAEWSWSTGADGFLIRLSDTNNWKIIINPSSWSASADWQLQMPDGYLGLDKGQPLVIEKVGNQFFFSQDISPESTCGNNIIEIGEDCEMPDRVYCDASCLALGNLNYTTLAGVYTPDDVCGNGIVEKYEECDTGDEPNNDATDGCTDACRYSGAVPGVGSLCGDNQITAGEECDNGQLTNSYCLCCYSGVCDPTDPYTCGGNAEWDCAAAATSEECAVGENATWCSWTASGCENNLGQPQLCVNSPKTGDGCTGTYINDTFPRDPEGHDCSTYDQDDCFNGLHANWCYWTGDSCRVRPCLIEDFGGDNPREANYCRSNQTNIFDFTQEDAESCQSGYTPVQLSTIEGNRNWGMPICGNGIVEYGEECDWGPDYINDNTDGCSNRCLNISSVAADGKIDPHQIIETTSVSLLLPQINEEIRAWHALDSHIVGIGLLSVLSGEEVPFQVIGHQPPNNTGPWCRNVAIWATFSKPLDQENLDLNDFRLCEGICDSGENIISAFSYQVVQGDCVDNACEYPLADEANQGLGLCHTDADCIGSKVTATGLKGYCSNDNSIFCTSDEKCGGTNTCEDIGFLKPNISTYRLVVNGTIQDLEGDALSSCGGTYYCNWTFSTSDDFCECDKVAVYINPTSGGLYDDGGVQTVRDSFTCAGNNCGSDTDDPFDDDVSGDPGNQHLYEAICFDTINPENTDIELSSTGIAFSWAPLPNDDLIYLTDQNSDPGDTYNKLYYVTPHQKDGESEVKVIATQHRLKDSGYFCAINSSPDCEGSFADDVYVRVTNFICENPWPGTPPYRDTDTNFKMYYCQDSGGPGTTDDLPSLVAPNVAAEITAGLPFNVFKEFIFPVCNSGYEDCGEANTTNDALAIRVMKNPLHLSPMTWYQSGLCDGVQSIESLCYSNADCGASVYADIVGYWPLDSGLDITASDFVGGNDGTIHGKDPGDDTWDPPTNSLILDGVDDYVSISSEVTDNLTSAMTACAWVKRSNLIGGNFDAIIGGSVWANNWLILRIEGSPLGRIMTRLVYEDGSNSGELEFASPDDYIDDTSWHHVCTSFERNDKIRQYLDGNQLGEGWDALNLDLNVPSPNNVLVGQVGNASYFDGQIDEVKIYSRALSGNEIRELSKSRGQNQCRMNVPAQGSPQSMMVDGYQAIKDGRTVYVGATNFDSPDLYSYIYLLSYNQGASAQTQEIFNRILDPAQQNGVWYFNWGWMTNHRICSNVGYYEGTNYVCGSAINPPATILGTAQSAHCHNDTIIENQADCEAAAKSHGCYWSDFSNTCEALICQPIYCLSDFNCPDFSVAGACSANKEKVVRDAKRFGDLRDIQLFLRNYHDSQDGYPAIGSGSYIVGTTFSVWPSWQVTLGGDLGTSLYVDPINRFKSCGNFYCDENENGEFDDDPAPAEPSCTFGVATECSNSPNLCLPKDPDLLQTCWDEVNLEFECPTDMFTYAYKALGEGESYELYTNFEYGYWSNGPHELPLDLAPICQELNFEINKMAATGGASAVACSSKRCYGSNWDPGFVSCNDNSFCEAKYCDSDDNGKLDASENTTCLNSLGCSGGAHECIGGGYCSGDGDGDGICDYGSTDNCPPHKCPNNYANCYNPDQRDTDGDDEGDVCDNNCSGDADNDGWCDEKDNCRTVHNCDSPAVGAQTCVPDLDNPSHSGGDRDGDGFGDLCDPCTDLDGDGWWDINTGSNDEAICPKDNCPYDVAAFLAGDRFGYCEDNKLIPCRVVEDCTAEELTGPCTLYGTYNPYQEDYDNDGKGYICDDCLDFDGDNFGDYPFYTRSSDPADSFGLSAEKLEHFQGCQGDSSFVPFADSATGEVLSDLDNCPGGPYGSVCKDKFGIKISCYNPAVASWYDLNGSEHENSQEDYYLVNRGGICNLFGDGVLDSGEFCDCDRGGYATIVTGISPDTWACQSPNNIACADPADLDFEECCNWCDNGSVVEVCWDDAGGSCDGNGECEGDETCGSCPNDCCPAVDCTPPIDPRYPPEGWDCSPDVACGSTGCSPVDVTCTKDGCDSVDFLNNPCNNLDDDGCCLAGDSINNEYSCPIRPGDSVTIQTVGCDSEGWHDPTYLGYFDDNYVAANNGGAVFVIKTAIDTCRSALSEFVSELKHEECFSIADPSGVYIGFKSAFLLPYWLHRGANEPRVWKLIIVGESKDSGTLVKLGDKIQVENGWDGDHHLWSVEWDNNDYPIRTDDHDHGSDCREFYFCRLDGDCGPW